MDNDTIAALSTPMGRGGIGVIRISGSSAYPILKKIITPVLKKKEPRKLFHGFIKNKKKQIDECLFVCFFSPNSFTGEDVVEISIHSNPFIIEEVLNLITQNGARLALPGEFSYRAYKNGKVDLLQAEAINSLIMANSRSYTRMQFQSLQGKLSAKFATIRTALIELAGKVETIIEFQEDQNLQEIEPGTTLKPIIKELDKILCLSRFSDSLNQGIKIALAGKFNSGKSTLFNTLLQEERSITSTQPGTTRDFISERLFIGGIVFEISDLAGFQCKSIGKIEKEGIKKSRMKVMDADAVIFVLDAIRPLEKIDREIYVLIKNKKKLLVLNKTDIAPNKLKPFQNAFPNESIIPISAKHSTNLDPIHDYLRNLAAKLSEKEGDIAINFRQKQLIEKLLLTIKEAFRLLSNPFFHIEMAAEEIRKSLDIIGQLTGETTTEDILREIFGQFCIGK